MEKSIHPVVAHLTFDHEQLRKLRCNRLLTLACFRIRDEQPTMGEVELFSARCHDLPMSHGCVEAESDE
jgi:hypothetical protein